MIPAQKIALKILRRILDKNWIVEDAFKRDARIDLLCAPDKKLLREMVTLTLRHMGEVDRFLRGFTKEADLALYLGTVQIMLMGLPAKKVAAIMSELAEEKKEKSLYSAVLNRLDHKVFLRDAKINYQNWMSGSWKKAYGEGKAAEIMEIMLKTPLKEITLKSGVPADSIPDAIILPNNSLRLLEGTKIRKLPGYKDGNFWIQDSSSANAVAEAGELKGKKTIYIFSTKGDKAAQLIDLGAETTLVNFESPHAGKVKFALARLGFNPEITEADGRTIKGKYDFAFIDAPNSCTGLIGTNPELLHQCDLDIVRACVTVQKDLIANAHNILNKNGILVYYVNSLQYEEGEGLMRKIDATQWKLLEEKRVLPCDWAEFGGIEGAYYAKLQKL